MFPGLIIENATVLLLLRTSTDYADFARSLVSLCQVFITIKLELSLQFLKDILAKKGHTALQIALPSSSLKNAYASFQ